MVKIKNPETEKLEEVDDYHYFDVEGEFPNNTTEEQEWDI